MHSELVEKRRWISEERFLHALNYCMLLPGPEATQLATYVGWLLHQTKGGIAAGVLFVLPSAIILWLLSCSYVYFGKITWVESIFYGLRAVVIGIVALAVVRIGKRALKNQVMWMVAALAFVGICFVHISFPVIVFAAAAIGFVGARISPKQFGINPESDLKSHAVIDDGEILAHAKPSWRRAFRVPAICLVLWWLPVGLIGICLGWNHTLFREGIFFSKASVVTFGGAYAVLPHVSQQAVSHYQWLAPGQMVDGLGLAETTPGPLIMVLQFVGFVGGWQHPGNLPPLVAATLGAFITTWTTFVPCFLWIFLGAPHIEQLRGNSKLSSALSTVTAAVVGVILNLAVWFGLHVLFPTTPQGRGIDWFAVTLAFVSLVGMWRWNWNILVVIVGAGVCGVIYRALI